MTISKRLVYAAAGLCLLAVVGTITAPKISAAIKATYVQLVLPDKAYTYELQTGIINGGYSVGPGTGTLGVTSLTITNYDNNPQDIFVFIPVTVGAAPGSCGGFLTAVQGPSFHVIVGGISTLHLPFPSPLIVNALQGAGTCIGLQAGTPRSGNVNITVNGFVN